MSEATTQPKYYRPGDPLDKIVPFLCPACGGINDARQYALLRLAATIPLMLPFKQCQCPPIEEVSKQKPQQEKTIRELAMDTYEDILHADMQIAMVQIHIPHMYPKLYEECERAHAGISHALNLTHKMLSAASNAEKTSTGKSEEVCKQQIGDPSRAIFTLGLEYGEGKDYSEEDRACGNFVRVLDARERALREAAMRLFSESEHQLYSFRYCATEQLPNYFARKYIWRDVRPQHIDWLRKAKDAGFIDSLIIDYEPEQEAQKL